MILPVSAPPVAAKKVPAEAGRRKEEVVCFKEIYGGTDEIVHTGFQVVLAGGPGEVTESEPGGVGVCRAIEARISWPMLERDSYSRNAGN